MKTRSLGSLEVSALGLGCMGMSYAYGPVNEAESLRVLRRYVELSGNFLDTAEAYGPYKNEELVGRFLVSGGDVVFPQGETPTQDGVDLRQPLANGGCRRAFFDS